MSGTSSTAREIEDQIQQLKQRLREGGFASREERAALEERLRVWERRLSAMSGGFHPVCLEDDARKDIRAADIE